MQMMRTKKPGKKLNKRVIRQTLGGYARANKFIEAEKRVWLRSLTPEQSWAIFDELYCAWESVAQNHSEKQKRIDESRLKEKIALRRMLDRASQKYKQKDVRR